MLEKTLQRTNFRNLDIRQKILKTFSLNQKMYVSLISNEIRNNDFFINENNINNANQKSCNK